MNKLSTVLLMLALYSLTSFGEGWQMGTIPLIQCHFDAKERCFQPRPDDIYEVYSGIPSWGCRWECAQKKYMKPMICVAFQYKANEKECYIFMGVGRPTLESLQGTTRDCHSGETLTVKECNKGISGNLGANSAMGRW